MNYSETSVEYFVSSLGKTQEWQALNTYLTKEDVYLHMTWMISGETETETFQQEVI